MTTERTGDIRTGEDIDDASAGSLTDDEQAQAAEIRAEIEEAREEMGGTLNELGDRLEPSHLMQQAKENVRDATIGRVEETARGTTDMVMETIKRNPDPGRVGRRRSGAAMDEPFERPRLRPLRAWLVPIGRLPHVWVPRRIRPGRPGNRREGR